MTLVPQGRRARLVEDTDIELERPHPERVEESLASIADAMAVETLPVGLLVAGDMAALGVVRAPSSVACSVVLGPTQLAQCSCDLWVPQ